MIRSAESISRIEFSVFVGRAPADVRGYATDLHASLVAPDRSVLLLVEPRRRAIEIVTGETVRRRVSDDEVDLAVMAMQGSLVDDDLLGALTRAITQMAEAARH